MYVNIQEKNLNKQASNHVFWYTNHFSHIFLNIKLAEQVLQVLQALFFVFVLNLEVHTLVKVYASFEYSKKKFSNTFILMAKPS